MLLASRADTHAQGVDLPRPRCAALRSIPYQVQKLEKLAFPLFVKSLTDEGSIGISQASIVHDDEKLAERVDYIHRETGRAAIAEQYIEGREIYIGVLGNDRLVTLPPWELEMKNLASGQANIATGRAKWDPDYQKKVGLVTGPAAFDKMLIRKFEAMAKQTYRLLNMSGYARLDYRMTEDGRFYLLEANPNPQIAKDEAFARSAKHVGVDYEELLRRLVGLGLRYEPSKLPVWN